MGGLILFSGWVLAVTALLIADTTITVRVYRALRQGRYPTIEINKVVGLVVVLSGVFVLTGVILSRSTTVENITTQSISAALINLGCIILAVLAFLPAKAFFSRKA